MKPVIIFGAGDFARIAKVYLDTDSPTTTWWLLRSTRRDARVTSCWGFPFWRPRLSSRPIRRLTSRCSWQSDSAA